MPTLRTFKQTIAGEDYVLRLNYNSKKKGFSIGGLPTDFQSAITFNNDNELESKLLDDLKTAIKDYANAKRTTERIIAVDLQLGASLLRLKDDDKIFNLGKKFQEKWFHHDNSDYSLTFHYRIFDKETTGKQTKYYELTRKPPSRIFQDDDFVEQEFYRTGNTEHDLDNTEIELPFTVEAEQLFQGTQLFIYSITEKLVKFLGKEPEKIQEQILSGQTYLLEAKNNRKESK